MKRYTLSETVTIEYSNVQEYTKKGILIPDKNKLVRVFIGNDQYDILKESDIESLKEIVPTDVLEEIEFVFDYGESIQEYKQRMVRWTDILSNIL